MLELLDILESQAGIGVGSPAFGGIRRAIETSGGVGIMAWISGMSGKISDSAGILAFSACNSARISCDFCLTSTAASWAAEVTAAAISE
nr:hypothetical protein [Nocardia tengchongensis]